MLYSSLETDRCLHEVAMKQPAMTLPLIAALALPLAACMPQPQQVRYEQPVRAFTLERSVTIPANQARVIDRKSVV